MSSRFQVPYAGVHTFARASLGSVQSLKPGNVAVFGVPQGSSGLRQGMHDGPRAIREASVDFIYPLQSAGTLMDIETGRTLTWPNELKLEDLGDAVLYPEDVGRTNTSLRGFVASIVAKEAVPVGLGGDRSITYPLFLGFADGLKQHNRKAGLIQLSNELAMADVHPTWGKHWYGATLRNILDSGQVEAHNIAVVGVHGLQEAEEWDRAQTAGVTILPLNQVREQGMKATAEQALEIAGKGTDSVYLSLDISVVDPGYAPGQGSVMVGGLTARELLRLVRELGRPQVGAMDGVGVAPSWDLGGRAQQLVAEAIIEVIAPRVFQ